MTPSQATRPGFMLYFADWLLPCHILTDEQLGAITRAAIEYAQHGTIAHMDDMLSNAVLTSLLPKLDADARRYDETIAKRSMAGKISAAKRASPQVQHMFTPVDACQPKPEPNPKQNQLQNQYEFQLQYQSQINTPTMMLPFRSRHITRLIRMNCPSDCIAVKRCISSTHNTSPCGFDTYAADAYYKCRWRTSAVC